MNKFLPGIILVLFTWNVEGQPARFKQTDKKSAGTSVPDFKIKQITRKSTLHTAAAYQTAPVRSLGYFDFGKGDRPKVILRKNSPIYIEKAVTPLKSASGASHEDKFFRFLEESKTITNITNPREHFKVTGIHSDDLGITHIRSVQQYKGIEIYGSESILHVDSEKERFTGSIRRVQMNIPVNPAADVKKCLQIVNNDLAKATLIRELSPEQKKMLHYDEPVYSLVIYDKGDEDYALTWAITLRPNFIEEWKYFVDATSGTIIRKYNNTNSDGPLTGLALDLNNVQRSIDFYLDAGTYYLVNVAEAMYNATTEEGVILTLDANNTSTANLNYQMVTGTNDAWTNKQAAVSAHYNAQMTYEYFRSKFGRNSINGQGGNILSFVNVADNDGSSMENAFWNGQAVFYGNGGTSFKPLAGALDVAAHELGHGVISNTANLQYIGQSGAMNESFADIFGSMVDRDDWFMGEEVVSNQFPADALRNMQDPHNGGEEGDIFWQPSHLSEIFIGERDNGGVHINSGIPNHAFYLFATAVGKDKAEKVYYRALTEYLTKTSQFIDLRIAVVQAAKDIHGNTSAEATQAAEAFDAVGIQEDDPVEEPDDLDPNPGQQHLLIYNTDPDFVPTLWVSPVSGSNYLPLSETEMKGKPSATDDGTAAVFTGSDSKIYVISLDPDNPSEVPLSDEAIFDNVAVSKDGLRIAAISTDADAAIYVYDFGTEVWKTFNLYNPTTSDEDINAGGVLYADAIEFDHTGEYLIYDAYNELSSTTSEDISYWDVGFIKVWDNNANGFGDGSITKLFTSLPENVSIGNPVFSKNSPHIIAFDYFFSDGVDEEYAIYGANLETGDLSLITENTTLGYPSFSKNDDQMAYAADVATQTGFVENVYVIGLGADKISASGAPVLLINDARWPVFYATGNRELQLAPVANFTADYITGDAPLQVKFLDLSTNDPTSWSWTFAGGTPATSNLQNPEVSYNTPGTYKVTLVATNNTGSNTLNRNAYIVISGTTPTDETEVSGLSYYPNPVTDQLNIEATDNFTLRIFNQAGKLLMTVHNQRHIDVSELSTGMYIMEFHTGSKITQHKLIKQ